MDRPYKIVLSLILGYNTQNKDKTNSNSKIQMPKLVIRGFRDSSVKPNGIYSNNDKNSNESSNESYVTSNNSSIPPPPLLATDWGDESSTETSICTNELLHLRQRIKNESKSSVSTDTIPKLVIDN